jgi:hypothetical protein
MKAALSAIEQTTQALQQQVTATVVGLGLRRDQQLLQGALTTRELLETAARTQVTIFEQDEQLYCYPSLVRVLASERSILIDRTCERRLRPSIATDEVHAVSWRSWSPTIFSNSNSRTTVAGSAATRRSTSVSGTRSTTAIESTRSPLWCGSGAPDIRSSGRRDFGAGKSHLLEHLEHVALDERMLCSRVVISKETPLYDLARVFRAAVQALVVPGRAGSALTEIASSLDPDSAENARADALG